jgi:uncharacterized ion transporter superfamily protein YfcC
MDFIFLVGAICLSIVYLYLYIPTISVEINESYLYSYDFTNDNPFYKFDVDTVKVLDIKNNYVLYIRDGKEDSEYLPNFFNRIRPLNKK